MSDPTPPKLPDYSPTRMQLMYQYDMGLLVSKNLITMGNQMSGVIPALGGVTYPTATDAANLMCSPLQNYLNTCMLNRGPNAMKLREEARLRSAANGTPGIDHDPGASLAYLDAEKIIRHLSPVTYPPTTLEALEELLLPYLPFTGQSTLGYFIPEFQSFKDEEGIYGWNPKQYQNLCREEYASGIWVDTAVAQEGGHPLTSWRLNLYQETEGGSVAFMSLRCRQGGKIDIELGQLYNRLENDYFALGASDTTVTVSFNMLGTAAQQLQAPGNIIRYFDLSILEDHLRYVFTGMGWNPQKHAAKCLTEQQLKDGIKAIVTDAVPVFDFRPLRESDRGEGGKKQWFPDYQEDQTLPSGLHERPLAYRSQPRYREFVNDEGWRMFHAYLPWKAHGGYPIQVVGSFDTGAVLFDVNPRDVHGRERSGLTLNPRSRTAMLLEIKKLRNSWLKFELLEWFKNNKSATLAIPSYLEPVNPLREIIDLSSTTGVTHVTREPEDIAAEQKVHPLYSYFPLSEQESAWKNAY